MKQIRHDFHAHTTYSDGSDISAMVKAAKTVDLSGIGFTDHCVVYEDPFGRAERTDFDRTYRQRRDDIRKLQATTDMEIYDGVEINYDPNYEEEIRQFLREASFDYAIGSIHYAGEYDLMHPDEIVGESETTRRNAVSRYFCWQERLIDSGLFDIVGHVDLPIRAPRLRSVVRTEDYRRLSNWLADSEAVPELNGSALTDSGGILHPWSEAIDHFTNAGVSFVVGSDAHVPEQVSETLDHIERTMNGLEVSITGPDRVLRNKD